MLRRRLIAVLPLALVAAKSAVAEEKAPNKQVGQYVDLQPVALPVVVDGQLVNYVFVSVRLNLASGADTPRWRAKEPYFRDALVRAAHETPFTLATDYDKIDVAKMTASLMKAATAIAGPNVVRSIAVTSQVPSHRARAPRA
jgi:flagellar basal body-associated protein FliL